MLNKELLMLEVFLLNLIQWLFERREAPCGGALRLPQALRPGGAGRFRPRDAGRGGGPLADDRKGF